MADLPPLEFPPAPAHPERLALPVLRWRSGAWSPHAGPAAAPDSPWRIATFNTWFQGGDRPQRYAGLLNVLQASEADFIVLQEVTNELLDHLLAADWVRSRWCVSHAPIRPDAVPRHGMALLSRAGHRHPVLHALPTHMGRGLLVADVPLPDGGRWQLATVHLESMRAHAGTRSAQLERVFALLEDVPDVVLAGDFNIDVGDDEQRQLDPRYQDAWAGLHPGEPGYTQDTGRNGMLARARGEARQKRIDRVLLRSDGGRLAATGIALIGTRALDDRGRVFPSDHFGLLASVAYSPRLRAMPSNTSCSGRVSGST